MSLDVPTEWYSDFFTELPNEFWRRAVPPSATATEVAFVERQLDLNPGSRILDVPCGSGRHTLALAARGHRVRGLDISTEAVDHARDAAAAAGLDVELAVADMRDLPRDGSFDAALCLGNSLGYLDFGGLREFLAGLAASVRPGGGLAVEVGVTAESILPGYTGPNWSMQVGDISASGSSTYDVERSRLVTAYEFARGDEVFRRSMAYFVYTSGHLGLLLEEAGFTDVGRWADAEGTPFTLGAHRMWVTARRR